MSVEICKRGPPPDCMLLHQRVSAHLTREDPCRSENCLLIDSLDVVHHIQAGVGGEKCGARISCRHPDLLIAYGKVFKSDYMTEDVPCRASSSHGE